MAEHDDARCDYCGKIDNHPKSHWSTGESYHLDCLPYDKRNEFVSSHPLAQAILDAAQNKSGEELRTHLADLHANQEEGI